MTDCHSMANWAQGPLAQDTRKSIFRVEHQKKTMNGTAKSMNETAKRTMNETAKRTMDETANRTMNENAKNKK